MSYEEKTPQSRDITTETWLRNQVAPAYNAMKADPSRAVSLEHVRDSLAAMHQDKKDLLVIPTPRTDFAHVPESPELTENKQGLKEYLQGGPKVDEFEIEPDSDTGREITL